MPELAVLILICIAMLNHGRHKASFAIAIASLIHLVVVDYIYNLQTWYFLSAVFPSAIVALYLLSGKHKTSLALDLSWIMLAQMVVNAFGWVMYELGQQATIYNTLSALFYICIIIRLIIRTKRDAREHASLSNRVRIYKPNIICVQVNSEGKP
jgi:hypothetical protein